MAMIEHFHCVSCEEQKHYKESGYALPDRVFPLFPAARLLPDLQSSTG